jgi:hypothetical protein
VKNPTCRHILFGACHDNGYVRMLEDFAGDSAIVDRVTLLYSFSVGKEFKKLPFRSTTLDTVFRTAPLEASTTTTMVRYQGVSSIKNTHDITPKTWAALARSNRKFGEGSVPATTNPTTIRMVLVNAAGHRVDVQLPRPSQTAINSWNHRIKVANMRYCRMYHLNDNCPGGCGYTHGSLLDEHKLAYRVSLRAEGCHVGLECRDINCHYRHNCSCKKPGCKFPREMHGVDDTTAEVWAK